MSIITPCVPVCVSLFMRQFNNLPIWTQVSMLRLYVKLVMIDVLGDVNRQFV